MTFNSFAAAKPKKPAFRHALPFLMAGASVLAIGAFAFSYSIADKAVEFDRMGCLSGAAYEMSAAVIAVDSSVAVSITESQKRDIRNAVLRSYDEAAPNARISIVTNALGEGGSVIGDDFMVGCKPPDDAMELAGITDRSADPVSLRRAASKSRQAFEEEALSRLESVMTEEKRARISPLFADIQGIRGANYGAPLNSFVWVTDGHVNNADGAFCETQNAMPPAKDLIKRPTFAKVRPESFKGIAATVYLLQRFERGPYCKEGELAKFWEDWFSLMGAENPRIIPVHLGVE